MMENKENSLFNNQYSPILKEMNFIYVIPKKSEEKLWFDPRSESLRGIIQKINQRGLSLEEAEEKAGLDKGAILIALEKDNMLSAMDLYRLMENI
jgi:hypothetical protein